MTSYPTDRLIVFLMFNVAFYWQSAFVNKLHWINKTRLYSFTSYDSARICTANEKLIILPYQYRPDAFALFRILYIKANEFWQQDGVARKLDLKVRNLVMNRPQYNQKCLKFYRTVGIRNDFYLCDTIFSHISSFG